MVNPTEKKLVVAVFGKGVFYLEEEDKIEA